MVVCNNHYRLLIFLIFLFNMGVVILILKHNNGLCYDDNRNAGIYPSNFDFRYTAQKTQSFNWVFKFNLRKILLKHLDIALRLQINLLTRFLLFWAIYLFSRCKKADIFQGFYPLNNHQGSALNSLRRLQNPETPTCILQHSKTQSLFKNWH